MWTSLYISIKIGHIICRGCLKHIDVAFTCEAKYDLMAKLEVEFED
jgi:hypothetical protein